MDIVTPNWLAISFLISGLNLPLLGSNPFLESHPDDVCYVTRAAYDIGSQGTKYMLANVDICQGTIAEVIVHDTIAVPYRDDLNHSTEKKFSRHIKKLGTQALHQAKQTMKQSNLPIAQHCAIATASFRAANNADEFIHELLNDVNIQVHTLSQEEEGKLAYYSALSKQPSLSPLSTVVWDIGGGSMQLTLKNAQAEWTVLGSELASQSFLKIVLEEVLEKSLDSSPHPMSLKQIQKALNVAQKKMPMNKRDFKDANVMAVGAVHNHVIQPFCRMVSPTHVNYYTQRDLEKVIQLLANKSDDEINKMLTFSGQDNVRNQLTNVILVYATMKTFNIQKVSTVQASNVEGLLIKGC